ncbi:hypothetical protein OG226_50225 [Streptomyces sp. NBC_01261]|uniref:hypothetical protein n=1 Tax=Streptomyces sp. NBC_01261 TaxID=2903802 RepID=UPI002E36A67D|nr:hypothetical protein [Streptomyces sp. NBC_01261]
MGREKMNKPRKPHNEKPRIVDMVSVPVATQKNVILTYIMSAEDPTWRMVEAGVRNKYGEFTVAERDLLDLPAQARTEALNDLALYASAQMPLQAPMEVREQAARTAANCQQALTRLRSAL